MNTKQLRRQIAQVMKSGQGYGPEFIPVLKQTISILDKINIKKPTSELFFQLGESLLQLEDSLLAREAFQESWRLDPLNLPSATYLALLLEQAGLLKEAIRIYLKINEIDTSNGEIVTHVLELAYQLNDVKYLLTICQTLLQREAGYASVYEHIARVYYASGNYERFLYYVQVAVDLEPNNPAYVNLLINGLYKNHRHKELIQFSSYLLEPKNATLPTRLMLPNSCASVGDLVMARSYFVTILNQTADPSERFTVLTEIGLFHANFEKDIDKSNFINRYILKRDPDNLAALTNLAMFCRPVNALEYYQRALAIAPDSPMTRLNYGLHLLSRRELEQGFKYYRARIKIDMPFLEDLVKFPEELDKGPILLWNEQGLGDQIIWSFLFRFLQAHGVDATIQVEPRLKPLFENSFPKLNFIDQGTVELYQAVDLRDYSANFPFISLGDYYIDEINSKQKAYLNAPEQFAGYLKADSSKVKFWQSRLNDIQEPKVGICWRSSLIGNFRGLQYLSAQDMVSLFKGTDFKVVNLQYSYTEDELHILKEGLGEQLIHFDDLDLKDDQDNLAALISCLDSVFSVATAVRALAGALGQTVFAPNGTGFLGYKENFVYSNSINIYKSDNLGDCLAYYRDSMLQHFNSR